MFRSTEVEMTRHMGPVRAALAAATQQLRRYSRSVAYRGRHRVAHGELSTMDLVLSQVEASESASTGFFGVSDTDSPIPAAEVVPLPPLRLATSTTHVDVPERQRPMSIGETMRRRAQLTQAVHRSQLRSAA
jgi:hypothetical protein